MATTDRYDDAVEEFEREVNDQPVTVTVIEDDEARIIVRADAKYEFVVDEGWAYPRRDDQSLPRWMESLLADFGVRGIRAGGQGEA